MWRGPPRHQSDWRDRNLGHEARVIALSPNERDTLLGVLGDPLVCAAL